jgi:hypothetical protein
MVLLDQVVEEDIDCQLERNQQDGPDEIEEQVLAFDTVVGCPLRLLVEHPHNDRVVWLQIMNKYKNKNYKTV